MQTVVEIEPTVEALARHLEVEPGQVSVLPYSFDKRTGWDTYIVTVDERPGGINHPVGFTNGPVT